MEISQNFVAFSEYMNFKRFLKPVSALAEVPIATFSDPKFVKTTWEKKLKSKLTSLLGLIHFWGFTKEEPNLKVYFFVMSTRKNQI